jgi:hypothetical protein
MKRGQLLIYAGSALGLPDKAKGRFLSLIRNFVKFSQANGLMSRVLLRERQKASIQTSVFRSDLTDEGFRFFKAAYPGWSEAVVKGMVEPRDIRILAETLAKLRGGKAERKQRPTKPKAGEAKQNGSPVLIGRAKRAASRKAGLGLSDCVQPANEVADCKAAGPHVYDKADWHIEGDFPDGLSADQANVHTGMFVGWLCEHDLTAGEFQSLARQVKRRKITGPQAYKTWGGVFASDMMTAEANQFARAYYEGKFISDFCELLARDLPSFYHVADSWKNFELLKKRIDRRFEAWTKKRRD